MFCCFSSIYVEDLNYLHNLGYFFIFPILYIMQKQKESGTAKSIGLVLLIVLLTDKPINSILVLLISLTLTIQSRLKSCFYSVLALFNIGYLFLYQSLPKRLKIPTSFDLSTMKPLLLNIPWLLGFVLLPIFYVGLMGYLHFLNQDLLRETVGLWLYVLPALSFFFAFPILWKKRYLFKKSPRILVGAMILSASYILIYFNPDSYWIKSFPLYSMNFPHHLLNRWTSLIPIFLVALLWIFGSVSRSRKLSTILLWLVMSQEFLLQLIAFPWLRRSW